MEEHDESSALLGGTVKPKPRPGGIFNLVPSVYVILPLAIILSLLFIGTAPLMPELLLKWFEKCTPDEKNLTILHCKDDFEKTQKYSGLFTVVKSTLFFLFSPQIGRLTDYHGRKPILIITSLFSWLPILALYLSNTDSPAAYYTVIISGALFGVTESSSFSFLATYVSDCTSEKDRTVAIGLVGATTGFAMAITPLMNSFSSWLDNLELFLLFLTILGIIGTFYVLLVVPESHLVGETKTKLRFELVNPVEPLKFVNSSKVMLFVSIIYFCGTFAESGVAQIALLYINEIYHLAPKDRRSFNSYVFSALGFTNMFSQSVIVKTMISQGFLQSTIVSISQLFNAVHIFWYVFLQYFGEWFYFVNSINTGLSFMANVALFSYISKNVNSSELGFAMGTVSSLRGIAAIFGPLLFSQIYALLGDSSPFLIGTIFAALACVLSHFFLRPLERDSLSGLASF